MTANKRYTVVYLHFLIDRTSPYVKNFSECFLREFKNYQYLRPIVKLRVEEDDKSDTNNLLKKFLYQKEDGFKKTINLKIEEKENNDKTSENKPSKCSACKESNESNNFGESNT